MANEWKVKFTDDDEDGIQTASFNSCHDAEVWIDNQEVQNRYDNVHFKVVEGPYREGVQQVHESKEQFDAGKYVEEFKDYFGYVDGYMPKKSYGKEMDSLAAECALRMPTDTAAREIEGDAVMLLVLSGEEDAVKVGKKLGDCMMKKGKHDEETLLKRMSDAYKALQELWAKYENNIKEAIEKTFKGNAVVISESWNPSFDKKPQNQWGEPWRILDNTNWLRNSIESVANDCRIDPSNDSLKIDRLTIDCIHLLEDTGNLIVSIFGGANGGSIVGHCNFTIYLALVKKFICKLLDHSLSLFEDAWLIEWDNDCCDDVWTIHFVLKPTNDTLLQMYQRGMLKNDVSSLETNLDESTRANSSVDARAMSLKQFNGTPAVQWERVTDLVDNDGQIEQHVWLKAPNGVLVCRIDTYGERSTYYVPDLAKNELVEVGHDGFAGFVYNYSSKSFREEIPDDMPAVNEDFTSSHSIKIWVDDIRPAPNGYLWLKSVDDFINYVEQHGIEGIAVFDFDHDAGDYASAGGDYIKCLDYLESIGAQGINVRVHSANPVGVKKMRQVIAKNGWNEVFDIIEESICTLNEQEDSAAKRRIVDAVKKASKDFQKAASNNDPTRFAKIVVAFDDLAAAVGAYDFKAKKELKESQQLDVDATAMLFKKYDGKMVNWEKLTWPVDDDGTLRQHVWMRSPDGVLVCRLDVYGEPSTYCIVDAAEEKLVEVGHGKTRGFTIFHFGYEPTHLEDIPDDIPTI